MTTAAPGITVTAVTEREDDVEDLMQALNVLHPGHVWAVTATDGDLVTVHGTPLAFWLSPGQRLAVAYTVLAVLAVAGFLLIT